MNLTFLNTFLKLLGLSICLCFSYLKIINFTNNSKSKNIFIALVCFILSIIGAFSRKYLSNQLVSLILYFLLNWILSWQTKIKFTYSIIVTIISIALSYISFFLSTFIIFTLINLFSIFDYTSPLSLISIFFIEVSLLMLLFNCKRLKNGIPFIKYKQEENYLDIFILILSIILLFIYFMIGDYNKLTPQYLCIGLFFFSLILIIITQKSFILYQKQKLLTKTLKEYETELTQTKEKLQTALQEKHTLVKSNHEFYHRQEALKQKLNTLIQTSTHSYSTETADEIAQIQDRINTLSEEYTKNTKTKISLPKTHIPELDDMFSYMQSECEKNNIEFILKLNNDINYMLENIIPKNKLETLIGDLLRNAIIAINHSKNEYKSIMAILGIKDNFFEFCVHDSGVDFEISTLLKLGTEPATTHKYSGGTGIGFITTFETLDYCNASIIINENPKSTNNYTKSIIIRFDNNHDYIINSYRADEISNSNNINRTIIVNDIKI